MKKRNSLLFFIIISVFANSYLFAQDVRAVKWISTTNDNAWVEKNVIEMTEVDSLFIEIDTTKTLQTIDGFGGCFNEMGWETLQLLPIGEQEKIIASIFDMNNGCKFNICRMPIGANDYAIDWYSFDETKDDFEMKDFSIARDKKSLIPYIKSAMQFNPNLKIWASPWCPPSWMKTNNNYACKPDSAVNNLPMGERGKEMVTQFRMDNKYLSAYALYFSKFVSAYKNEGINLFAVHVQNEPNSCQNFPSCVWTPTALATFIGGYLGPQLKKDNPDTEIWLGTIERPQIERVDTILTDPEARKYISGVGFQWGGKGAIPEVHKKYPDLNLMQTETVCGNGSNDWKAAERTFGLIKYYFENGASSYMYWNMILDETGRSRWGWKQNAMITIDSKTKKVTYNPEFYLMKHFSYFIEPGSFKLKTSDGNCLAFKGKKSLIVFYYNKGENTEKNFSIGNKKFIAKLAEHSLNTFKIEL